MHAARTVAGFSFGLALAVWLPTRLVLLMATVLSVHSLQVAALVAQWQHWDALWYERIAAQGYATLPATAFFPLYPLLIRLSMPLCDGNAQVAALLVSNLSELIAAAGIVRLLGRAQRQRGALAVLLVLTSPFAFFLAAPYADSVLLATVVWAFVGMRERRWWLASICGMLADLTHSTGILLVLPLLWECSLAHRDMALPFSRKGTLLALTRLGLRGDLSVGGPVIGMALYATFLQIHAHDALAFAHVEVIDYLRRPMWPWQSAVLAASDLWHALTIAPLSFPVLRQFVDDAPVVLAFIVTSLGWWRRRVPASVALFTLALILISISMPVAGDPRYWIPWAACGRYMLLALAVPWVVTDWLTDSRRARRTRTITLAALTIAAAAAQLALLVFFFRPDASFGLV